MGDSPRGRSWTVSLILAATLIVAAVAVYGAIGWYQRPFVGLLVDPDLCVSSIGLPWWEGPRNGLRFSNDCVAAIDDRPTTVHHGTNPLDTAAVEAHRAGRGRVRVQLGRHPGPRRALDLAVRPLEPLAWWIFAGGLYAIAFLYVGAGLLALRMSPRGPLARTFAKTAFWCALFLFTLFDYHTSGRLAPLFHVAFAMAPMGFIALALRLPDDAPVLVRFPWLIAALDVLGAALASGLVLLHALNESTVPLRQATGALAGIGTLFFAVGVLTRFVLARGARRATLRALLVAFVPPYAAMAIGFFVATTSVSLASVAWVSVPALALTPFASLVAFVKHDLWGSRALLSRVLTRGVIAVGACGVVVTVATSFAVLCGASPGGALIAGAAACALAALLVPAALDAGDRRLFAARAKYRPTIEQLSEDLTLLRDPDDVAVAVERTVRRWLPCERVEFMPVALPHEGDEARGELAADGAPANDASFDVRRLPGRSSTSEEAEGGGTAISLRVDFHGQQLAELRVERVQGDPLLTSEDLVLLRTIANLAALALAHARSYAELERRRRDQAAAWRGERAALLETVAAEIVHEVRYPINFFRSIFQRGSTGQRLDAEEVDIGCEEVERLERLVSGLRRVASHRLERRTVSLRELIARAEVLLRDQLGARALEVRVNDPCTVRCDPDQALQVLVNLLSNAVDAAGPHGAVGVTWSPGTGEGGTLIVWDGGDGLPDDPSRVFAVWYTTKAHGTGLGLAITHRLVRAHGWAIDAERVEGTTRFVISVPARDIVVPREGAASDDMEVA